MLSFLQNFLHKSRNAVETLVPPMLKVEPLGEQGARLNPSQKKFWSDYGFLILKDFIPKELVTQVNAEIEDVIKRRREIPNVKVDPLAGPFVGKRLLISEAPDEVFSVPFKLNDLYLESGIVRRAVLGDQLVAVLAELLEGDPIVINSLNFKQGSQQPYHVDTWYMPPPVPNKLVVSSICLEDIHPDAGPLFYYPGSHNIPPYRFSHGGIHAIESEMESCRAYLDEEIARRPLQKSVFLGSAGDVFIWHAQLLHGGMQIRDQTRTRKSLVTHYWRAQDLAPESVGVFDGNKYFYKRPHQA